MTFLAAVTVVLSADDVWLMIVDAVAFMAGIAVVVNEVTSDGATVVVAE